jgi:hypothetical protein
VRHLALRLLRAASGAFTGLSAGWAAWGAGVSGEHFGRADSFVMPSLLVAVLLGGWGGFTAPGRWRLLVYAAGLLSLCFWLIVP